ncbi:MAG: hypothetical protein K6T16_02670, partial [Candidatus Pacearchaeota archaeon]|nr:hypothetical protein [Candidatus Pacearchaeota archaeon]
MKEEKVNEEDIEEILLSLSPLERTIVPLLELGSIEKISAQAKLSLTSVKRAFQFLGNKKIVTLSLEKTKFVKTDTNGIMYLRKGLPERRLLEVLAEVKSSGLEEAKKKAGLSDKEFRIAVGTLKEKGFVDVSAGNLNLKVGGEEVRKKFPEERFLEMLPIEIEKLSEEETLLFKKLQSRKNIV